jgi:mono/diheme cytochrome c family protein
VNASKTKPHSKEITMRRILKWIALITAGLVIILAIAIPALYIFGNSRLYHVDVNTRPVQVSGDPAAIARGEHLVMSVSACIDCHGENLEGKTFLEDPMIGYMTAPNLTSGAGGIGSTYTNEDWERAIRHGVGGDGRVLAVMPSNSYAHLSDEDMAAMIAYLQASPPIDNILPERSISFLATIIFGVFNYAELPVAMIDHASVGSSAPTQGVSFEYGKYLVDVASCRDCHGADLTGRSPAQAEGGPPAGPNLTRAGVLGNWSEQDFITALRTGSTPDGRMINPEMPWPAYAGMSDEDLLAIWLYLENLPAAP